MTGGVRYLGTVTDEHGWSYTVRLVSLHESEDWRNGVTR